MELCFKISKMSRIFHKARGNISYEILDEKRYKRYWWGRKPSTRAAFEDWLMNPEKTQNSVACEHGKWPSIIQLQSRMLVKRGIIRRFKHESRVHIP